VSGKARVRGRVGLVLWGVCCVLLLSARAGSAEVIQGLVRVPGTWFDREKYWSSDGSERYGNYYHDLDSNGDFTPGEPWSEDLPAGGTGDVDDDWNKDVAESWGSWLWHRSGNDKWYYDDQNSSGSYDAGEPTSDSLAADIDGDHREDAAETWAAGWSGGQDESCWAAAASNVLRYASGSDRYHAWMYTEGCDGKTWANGGWSQRALQHDGYASQSVERDANNQYLTVNPIEWCKARLSEGLPLAIAMHGPSGGGHAVTMWGIDDSTQTMYFSDSDSDPGGDHFYTEDYTWQNNEWRIVWPGGGWQYLSAATTFATNNWQGSGTGGDTSMSGATTQWRNAANWTDGVPDDLHVPKLEFDHVGVVNIDGFAQSLKCIVKGANTKMAINGNGGVSARSVHVMDGGEIESSAGYLTADYEIINEASMDINGGAVSSGTRMYVGADATATVDHTGGSVGTDLLYLGHRTTGHGTYNLGGGVLTARVEYVGHEGDGYVVQTGGDNTTTDHLFVGYLDGSYGQYDLDGFTAELYSQDAWVGAFGRGHFYQTNGKHQLAGELTVGRAATADGLYRLEGGSILAPDEIVGQSGKGEFIHVGGINRVGGTLHIGKYAGSEGSYRMSGGVLEVMDGGEIIIGHQGTIAGMEISNGTVDAPDMTVGGEGAAEVDQTGGTVTIAGTLALAAQIGSMGTYRVNGAAAQLQTGTMKVGQAGTGTVYHTLGTNAVAGTLSLGSTSDGTGWYYLEPGATLTAAGVDIGAAGEGYFVQNGGLLDVRHGTLRIGGDTGTGKLTMNAGVVIADEIVCTQASGTFEDIGTDWILRVNILTGFGTSPSLQGTLQLGHTVPDGIPAYSLSPLDSLGVGRNLTVGHDGCIELTQGPNSTVAVGRTLYVGHEASGQGAYTQRGGLTVSGDAHVGYAGVGTMDQHTGTTTIDGTLHLGSAATGEGTYSMWASDDDQPILNASQELIGGLGTGTFWQWDGSHTVTAEIWVGAMAGSHGTYHLQGGSLHVPTLNIGSVTGGVAEFNWQGGNLDTDTVTVHPNGTMNVNIGPFWAIDGTLNVHGGAVEMESTPLYVSHEDGAVLDVTGGSLTTGEFRVGSAGDGTVTQSGGAVTTFGDFRMARYVSGSGTYTMDGGSLTVNGEGYVGDHASATFTQNDGGVQFAGDLYLGYESGTVGTYELFGGSLTCAKLYVGFGGTGVFKRLTGTTLNADEIRVADGSSMTMADHFLVPGYFGLHGSSLDLGTNHFTVDGTDAQSEMGHGSSLGSGDQCYGDTQKGAMKQMGGSNRANGALTLGRQAGSHGSYHMSAGVLAVADLIVGGEGEGEMHITGPGTDVTVERILRFGPSSTFTAVHNTAFHMTGSAFENESTDPAALAGLADLNLIFEGGTTDIDPFEVAGRDIGTAPGGWDLNFELGTLTLGGSAGIGQVVLVDTFDNQPGWEGNEALYVHNLVVGPGSTLDLNGLRLYYKYASIDPDAIVLGGGIVQIPEPATLTLLALGGLALRRKRRKR